MLHGRVTLFAIGQPLLLTHNARVTDKPKWESFSSLSGVGVALLGLSALAGWLFGIETLKAVVPGLTPMKADAASGFVLCGIALWLVTSRVASKHVWTGRAPALAVIFLAALALGRHILDWQSAVQPLSGAGPLGSPAPWPMSIAAALTFLFLGYEVLRLERRLRTDRPPRHYGIAAASVITLAILIGYLYSAFAERQIQSYTEAALHTGLGFAILIAGVVRADPGTGFVSILLARGHVGSMARRMMLAAVFSPTALGYAMLHASRFLKAPLGWLIALAAVLTAVVIAVVVVRSIMLAIKIEADRSVISKRFEQLVEAVPDGIVAFDRECRFVVFNSEAERMFGYTRDEVAGRPADVLFPERCRDCNPRCWRKEAPAAFVVNECRGQDLLAVRKNGSEFPIEISVAPVRDSSADLSLWLIHDVARAKSIQRTLEEAERNYRTIFENAAEGILRTAPDGRILMANRTLANMLAYESPEAFLSSVANVGTIYLRPETGDKLRTVLMSEGIIRNFECQVLDRNGRVIWVVINVRLVRDSVGKVIHYEGFLQDITSRKAAEALGTRFLQILERTPDLVAMADWKTRRVSYLNGGGRRLLGIGDGEDISGLTGTLLRPAWSEEAFETALRDGQHVGECALLHLDGREIPVHQIIIVQRTPDGEVDFVSTIARDLTKLKVLETQFHQAQRVESIGEFAGGIAHDFNNLLTVIIGYSQLLLHNDRLNPQLKKNVEGIDKAATRAAALTRQILAFGRRQILHPKVISLNTVVTDLEKMLRRLVPENIKLVTILESDLGPVRADSGQIEQVIINLSINARDAMPGGGTLTIETANTELTSSHVRHRFEVRPGLYAMMSVTDTGMGMDDETQSHIFEPFFTTKEAGKGTGLGLAVVYGIVKQSGGYIWLYSEPGRGSTFKIYLPRVEASTDETQPDLPAATRRPADETILLVEDDRDVREITAQVLRSAGYRVVEAEDAHDALRRCKDHGPLHLLLSDVVMPRMSGFELAKQARALRPELEAVFMSGYAHDAVNHLLELGPHVDLIEKPFSANKLLETVRQALDRAAAVERESELPMVLIVDDDAEIREFVSTVLKDVPCRVATAENGLAALQILKNTRCDLVIADVVMPYKDGIELGIELTREFQGISLILMSGVASPDKYLAAAPNLKVDMVLDKPLDAATLRGTVSAALRRRN